MVFPMEQLQKEEFRVQKSLADKLSQLQELFNGVQISHGVQHFGRASFLCGSPSYCGKKQFNKKYLDGTVLRCSSVQTSWI